MPFCPDCGGQYDASANYCPTCGRPLKAEAPPRNAARAESVAEIVTPRVRARIPGFVKDALGSGEPVLAAFNASLFDHRKQGLSLAHDRFVLTPQRIILYHTGLIHKGMGEIPYRMITGVSCDRGLFHGRVVVEAANAGLTMDGIGNDDASFAEKIIAGGIVGRPFEPSGPYVEPPLVSPFLAAFVVVILAALAVAARFAPVLIAHLR